MAMAPPRGLAACVAAVFACLLTFATAGGGDPNFKWDGGNHVEDLTIAELAGHLRNKREKNRMCLVMFHVSWCKVCQRTFPEFVAAAEQVKAAGIDVDFAHIDCEKSSCSGYIGRGYPTISLYQTEEGLNRTFKSTRNAPTFVKYAERMTMPAVRMGLTREELAKALDNETLSAFVTTLQSNKAVLPSVKASAKHWMDLHIFASSKRLEDLLPEGVSVPEKSSLAVLASSRQQWSGHDNTSKAKPAVAFFEGDLDNKEAVAEWVLRHRFPGIWKLDETNFFEFTHAERNTALLAVDPTNASKAIEAEWRGAFAEHSEAYAFGVVDSVSWKEELRDFNLLQEDMPRVLVTEENFDAWIEDVDGLRVVTATEDLRAYRDGSRQILRQSRTTMSKLWFWQREAKRFVKKMTAYASQGPMQAALVAVGAIASVIATLLVCWGFFTLLAFLFSDPDADEVAYMNKKTS